MHTPTAAAPESTLAPLNRSEGFSFSTYILTFVLAAILYALSPGPIAKFTPTPTAPVSRWFDISFAPLRFAYEKSPTVHRFYDWYIDDLLRASVH